MTELAQGGTGNLVVEGCAEDVAQQGPHVFWVPNYTTLRDKIQTKESKHLSQGRSWNRFISSGMYEKQLIK